MARASGVEKACLRCKQKAVLFHLTMSGLAEQITLARACFLLEEIRFEENRILPDGDRREDAQIRGSALADALTETMVADPRPAMHTEDALYCIPTVRDHGSCRLTNGWLNKKN